MMDIIRKIMDKINAVVIYLVIAGILFLALAITVIVYPPIVLYIFVISFGVMAILCFLAAERVFRIRELVEKLALYKK